MVATANRPLVTWIYFLPAWVFMTLCVLLACALAVAGLEITRTRIARNDQITHNDVAGPILATIGTVLAVMMSFMVVGVWQEYDNSAQNVQTEASSLSDLHELAAGFPQPVRTKLEGAVDKYITLVVYQEWPRMKIGAESLEAHDTAFAIQTILVEYSPRTTTQALLQSRGIELAGRFIDARRQRIHDNQQGIPLVLWATMLFLGFITIVFSYYFRVDRPNAQFVMVIALTCVVTITFTLIAELDYPFRGDISISPQAFTHVYNTVHRLGFGPP